MTHRERIPSPLSHRAPDGVAIDLNAGFSTCFNVHAYDALLAIVYCGTAANRQVALCGKVKMSFPFCQTPLKLRRSERAH
jgi:hypothetical protein